MAHGGDDELSKSMDLLLLSRKFEDNARRYVESLDSENENVRKANINFSSTKSDALATNYAKQKDKPVSADSQINEEDIDNDPDNNVECSQGFFEDLIVACSV